MKIPYSALPMSLARFTCLRLAARPAPPCVALPRAIGPIRTHQHQASQLDSIRYVYPPSRVENGAASPTAHLPKKPVKPYRPPKKAEQRKRAKEIAAERRETERREKKEEIYEWFCNLPPEIRALYEEEEAHRNKNEIMDTHRDDPESVEPPKLKLPTREQRRRIKLIERQYKLIRERFKVPEGSDERAGEIRQELDSWLQAHDQKAEARVVARSRKLSHKVRTLMEVTENVAKEMGRELQLEDWTPLRRELRALKTLEARADKLTRKAGQKAEQAPEAEG